MTFLLLSKPHSAAKSSVHSKSPLLKVPSNYYDDLDVRFNIPADVLSRLRQYSILYDVDSEGEYFQVFTDIFQERFFFQIVQRIGKYSQFGSVNGSIVMAAHHEMVHLRKSQYENPLYSSAPQDASSVNGISHTSSSIQLVVIGDHVVECGNLVAAITGRPFRIFESPNEEWRGCIVGLTYEMLGAFAQLIPASERKSISLVHFRYLPSLATSNVEYGDLETDFRDYEYVFHAPIEHQQKDLTRFVSFVLGERDFHRRLLEKERSMFLSLTFPDVSVALQNLDIITIGVDAVELRVDLLKNPGRLSNENNWQVDEMTLPSYAFVAQQVSSLRARTDLPLVFTCRSALEGGKLPAGCDEYLHRLLRLGIKWACEYVDVEIRMSQRFTGDIVEHKGFSRIIASKHDRTGGVKWSSAESLRWFHQANQYGDIN